MHTPRALKALYREGVNITKVMREDRDMTANTTEIIEVAYDLQAGSYVAGMSDDTMRTHKDAYGKAIAQRILSLCNPSSVLEAGVGEGTTMAVVMRNLGPEVRGYGFDLSWSRVAHARKWLARQGIEHTTLCTGDLFHIPLADDSIDVVYTSHSIEPNGGREADAIRELVRVARRYVLLLEPGHEFASSEGQARMESHGYCRDLHGTARNLGCDVVCHERFPHVANPLNPTALTIIRKSSIPAPANVPFSCPRYQTPLREIAGVLYSDEALVAYPIIDGIACLRIENGVLASALGDEAFAGDA